MLKATFVSLMLTLALAAGVQAQQTVALTASVRVPEVMRLTALPAPVPSQAGPRIDMSVSANVTWELVAVVAGDHSGPPLSIRGTDGAVHEVTSHGAVVARGGRGAGQVVTVEFVGSDAVHPRGVIFELRRR